VHVDHHLIVVSAITIIDPVQFDDNLSQIVLLELVALEEGIPKQVEQFDREIKGVKYFHFFILEFFLAFGDDFDLLGSGYFAVGELCTEEFSFTKRDNFFRVSNIVFILDLRKIDS
jgi:hypothetical protein